jgi:ABC-2 type transport system permease protein
MSAVTRNQVVAFILAAVGTLLFVLSGFPMVLDFFSTWAPELLVNAIAAFSFLTHFDAISKGVIELRDLVYFLSLIAFWLFATVVIVEMKKAD